MNKPLAYHMEGSPLCAPCALRETRRCFVLFQIFGMIESLPETMDDAIATLMLMDAATGTELPMPEPYALEFTCVGCGTHIPAVSEVA